MDPRRLPLLPIEERLLGLSPSQVPVPTGAHTWIEWSTWLLRTYRLVDGAYQEVLDSEDTTHLPLLASLGGRRSHLQTLALRLLDAPHPRPDATAGLEGVLRRHLDLDEALREETT
jgi:hypothetical protein